jgi:CheY-like chemotaxis protein
LHCALELPGGPVLVRADPIRLTQVFSNLLINARKFTPGGGSISVAVKASPADVEVSIADTGCGIVPELLPRVFDLFTQGPQAIERQHGGLGLGLAIAKSLVAMHGGSITAESKGAGKGATFRVRLPRQTAATGAIISSERPTVLRGHGERILVVDDHADVRETVSALLTSEGYKVRAAVDAHTALDIACAWQPQLALLDIGLPGIDGYELARRLRQQADAIGMRLLAITGYGGEADRRQALQAGFDDHIVKPVPAALLLQMIKALLKAKRA